MLSSLSCRLRRRSARECRRLRSGESTRQRHLRLESLEERTVLSGGVVTTSITGWDVGLDSFLQGDEIVVAGFSVDSNLGETDFAAVRYQGNGTLDPSFGDEGVVTTDVAHGYDYANAGVPYGDDGKILLAGWAQSKTGMDFALARYNADGSPDRDFGFKGEVVTAIGDQSNDRINDVMVQPDGMIVSAGQSNSVAGFTLTRHTEAGELDPSFGNGGIVQTDVGSTADYAHALAMHEGKILVAGETKLARYELQDGSLDSSFGTGGIVASEFDADAYWQAITIEAHENAPDKIVVVGVGLVPGSGGYDLAVARYLSDGTPDTTFGIGGLVLTDFGGNAYDNAYDVAIQDDGNIVVVGFTDFPERQFTVGRYLPDGTLDPTFGSGGKVLTPILNSAEARSMDIQDDGKIVVSGFANGGSGNQIALARYNTDGSLDETFGVTANNPPDAVDDSATTDMDTPVTIDVLANDTDPDVGDILSVTSLGTPGAGAVVDHGDGTVTYTPDVGATGPDSFTYTISDGNGGEDTATVHVTVTDPSAGQTYTSGDTPQGIADPHPRKGPRTTTSEISITSADLIGSLVLAVDITHGAEAGLTVTLENSALAIGPQNLVYDSLGDSWGVADPNPFVDQALDGTWTLSVTDTVKDSITGTLQSWSMTVTAAPVSATSTATATETDLALLALTDLDPTDDDETDPLTESLVDDLALMLV